MCDGESSLYKITKFNKNKTKMQHPSQSINVERLHENL